jgi:hypothetical protein
MNWLGISFPRWLENELRLSAHRLQRSIDLCEAIFADVQDYARDKGIPSLALSRGFGADELRSGLGGKWEVEAPYIFIATCERSPVLKSGLSRG